MDRNEGDLLSVIKCFPDLNDLKIQWSLPSARRSHWIPSHLPGFPNPSLTPTCSPLTCLPRLRRLQILLEPCYQTSDGFTWAVHELASIFNHLPLIHVRHLHVFFEEIIDPEELQGNIEQLRVTMGAMRFARLETFHRGFNFEVYSPPEEGFWVRHR